MGLLKDSWDILKDQPEVRKWLAEHAVEAYGYLKPRVASFFRGEPDRPEAIRQSSTIFEAIARPEFSSGFASRLAFLEFLLTNIVNAVDSKEQGVVLRDFYIPGKMVYFPMDYRKKELVRTPVITYAHTSFVIGRGKFFEGRYRFYVIDGEVSPDSVLGAFNASITAASTESAVARFARELEKVSATLSLVDSLFFFPERQLFALAKDEMFTRPDQMKYILAFGDTERTRKTICEDVQRLLKAATI